MFARLPEAETGARVRLLVDGVSIDAQVGDSVAAALLAAGYLQQRSTPISGTGRAPYCMMGACFECLVTIDGVGSRQGCLTPVREGMRIGLKHGTRDVP